MSAPITRSAAKKIARHMKDHAEMSREPRYLFEVKFKGQPGDGSVYEARTHAEARRQFRDQNRVRGIAQITARRMMQLPQSDEGGQP